MIYAVLKYWLLLIKHTCVNKLIKFAVLELDILGANESRKRNIRYAIIIRSLISIESNRIQRRILKRILR